uniref:Uncharacterized protein n=1 Tax=Arundo donax TaxID=35708 RepID=A0A0A9FF62_ARUDO
MLLNDPPVLSYPLSRSDASKNFSLPCHSEAKADFACSL